VSERDETAPIEDVETAVLVGALEGIVKKGLPLTEATAGDMLPQMRSAYARAVVPSERRSRIAAMNDLLPRLIATISDSGWWEATQILFGLAPGSRKALLTERDVVPPMCSTTRPITSVSDGRKTCS
jgi:hypothetical protein